MDEETKLRDEALRIMDHIEGEVLSVQAALEAEKAAGVPESWADKLMAVLLSAISDAKPAEAQARVAALREEQPDASVDDLVESIIKRRCQQTAAIGAASSGAALIPGLGTLTALTVGIAADISATFRLQAEMVLEIAAAHKYPLNELEQRQVLLLMTGVSAGSHQLLKKVARSLTEQYAAKWFTTALPLIGMATSSGANVVATYTIGRRAHSYFGHGPEALSSWRDSLRALSGMDERKVVTWVAESGGKTVQAFAGGAQTGGVVIVNAGKSVGEAVVTGAVKLVEGGKTVGGFLATGAEKTAEGAKAVGGAIATGAGKTAEGAKSVGSALASGASKTTQGVIHAGTAVTQSVAKLLPRKRSEDAPNEAAAAPSEEDT